MRKTIKNEKVQYTTYSEYIELKKSSVVYQHFWEHLRKTFWGKLI